MTLWQERFVAHQLWVAVRQAREAMNRVAMPTSDDDRKALEYAGMVLELVERRREDTDGREVTPQMLSAVHNHVSPFASYLDGIPAGSYSWANVVAAADEIITALGQWPPMKINRWLAGLNAAVESFQRKTSEALDRTSEQAATAERRASELATEIDSLSAKVAGESQKIAEAIAVFTVDGQKAVRELLDAQQTRIEESETEWREHLVQQEALADEHNARMAQYEEKSVKVLEAVGTNSTATDYGKHAHEQGRTANRWRVIASAVFGLASIWFIISSLPWATAGTTTWESSLSRLGVTAAVAGVGVYAARESSQHRKQERAARKVQLVLIALEPFIANLPEDKQVEIRAEAAKSIFVLPEEVQVEERDLGGSSTLDLARALIDKLPNR